MIEKMLMESIEIIKQQSEKEALFDQSINDGIDNAFNTVKKRFETSNNPDDNLEFHDRQHTENVIRRTKLILSTILRSDSTLLTERDVKIGCLAAAFHDVVQKYEKDYIKDNGVEKIIRKRALGDNENESSQEALVFMEKTNKDSGIELFSQDDKKIIKEAFDATIPDFDVKKNTVVQPNLNKNSSLIARSVALADIGTAGLDGPKIFLSEGDKLFREENLDIAYAVDNLDNITDTQKEYFISRMLGWSAFQEKFAQDRKDNLDKEIEGLSENTKNQIRGLFNKFDDSIKAARKKTEQRKIMSFEELLKDMGYQKKIEVIMAHPNFRQKNMIARV